MLDDKKVQHLYSTFDRIFAMPITRSTMRQVQNAVQTVFDNNEDAAQFIEILFRGENKDGKELSPGLRRLVEKFNVKAWIAKDIYEKGEFINLLTSDAISQPNRLILANSIRRVDGEEFQFLTDFESTLQLLSHFMGRLRDAEKIEATKKLAAGYKDELQSLKTRLDELLAEI